MHALMQGMTGILGWCSMHLFIFLHPLLFLARILILLLLLMRLLLVILLLRAFMLCLLLLLI